MADQKSRPSFVPHLQRRKGTERSVRRKRRGTVKKLADDAEFLFWHNLTLAVGGCTVAELKARMSSKEAASWKRYQRIRGSLGERREDIRSAMLCYLLCAVNGNDKVTVDDFIVKGKIGSDEELTPQQEVENILKQFSGK